MSTNSEHEPVTETENLMSVPENSQPTEPATTELPAAEPPTLDIPAPMGSGEALAGDVPTTELPASEAPTLNIAAPMGSADQATSEFFAGAYAPPTPTAMPAPPSPPPTPAPEQRQPRISTVVWGLIIALIGALTIAAGIGARFDLDLVIIGLLVVAGIALVVGAIWSAARNSARKGR